jgi:hypothetical protein
VLFGDHEKNIAALLSEIYEAVDAGQHRLAAMGIRSLLEQVMTSKVGLGGTFEQKLDVFQESGYVSLVQRDAVRETLELGHAAIHRSFAPSLDDLSAALDIVEGVLAPIFHHPGRVDQFAKRVPPRPKKKS